MNDINRWLATGRITRDPQLKFAPNGAKVLEFSIAVNESRRVGDAREDRANFFDCAMFGNRAESLAQILTKGMRVTVEASLKWHQWEKDGVKRSKVTAFVDDIVLPPREKSEQQAQYQPSGYADGYQPSQSIYANEDIAF